MSDSNVDKVIMILRENSFEEEAIYFEELVEQLSSTDETVRSKAVKEIQGLCQVCSYGNLNIKTMNGWKWNTLLEKVGNRIRK
jgi:hypothetical protein